MHEAPVSSRPKPGLAQDNMANLQAIKYSRGRLDVLDQLRLPHEHHYDEVSTCEEAFDCIKSMRVRGAPAIAIVAALALAVELQRGACSKSRSLSLARSLSVKHVL